MWMSIHPGILRSRRVIHGVVWSKCQDLPKKSHVSG